jgi:hypothetical protein
MPLNPGTDTVTFVFPGVLVDRLHKVQGSAGSQFDQNGCNVQPLSAEDKVSDTEYSEATDKCLAPYNDLTASVLAEWRMEWAGQDFRIMGCRPYRDPFGRGVHILFTVKREEG